MSGTTNQEVTLNIRYDIPDYEWKIVSDVYRSMEGWLDADDLPRWFGFEDDPMYIWASVEPGGIQFVAKIDSNLWAAWLADLCFRLSAALGREIHDAEL